MTQQPVSARSDDETFDLEVHPAFILVVSILILGSILGVSTFFWYSHPLLQYPDQSMYLAMAQLFLDGYKPYVEMVDFNPPLILYISLAPALISRMCHIPVTLAFAYFVIGLTLVSVLICGYLMFKNRRRDEAFYYLPMLMVLLYMGRELTLDFGQREHLLLITYMPFFVIRHFRWDDVPINKYFAFVCGLYSAVCLILKPHFLFMAAVPELIYFLRKRQWRKLFAPEVYAVILAGIIYSAHFLFIDSSVRERFFQFVVPLVRAGYDYYTVAPLKTIADFSRIETYYFAAIVTLSFVFNRYCSFVAPMSAFTLGAFFIYYVAAQDWSHHWVPVQFGMYSLLALYIAVLVRWLGSYSGHARLLNMYMTAVVLVVATLCSTALKYRQIAESAAAGPRFDMKSIGYSGTCTQHDLGPWVDLIERYTMRNEPVLFMSDAIAPGYPAALQADRLPASRYLHAMPLMMAKYLTYEKSGVQDRAKFDAMYDEIIKQYSEDIERNKPALIVIRNSGIMEPLQRADFFNKYLKDYENVDTVEEHFIYKRKQP